MRVLIIGRSDILYDTALLLADEHEICGVVTAPATNESTRKENDFHQLAERFSCPFLAVTRIDEAVLRLAREAAADVAVSVNWVSVIGPDFISAFPRGVLNAHCGDLPRYRGNAVMNWALLRDEPEVCISVHTMLPGLLDLGDIFAQDRIPLTQASTIAYVMDEVVRRTPGLFVAALQSMTAAGPLKALATIEGEDGFRCYPRIPVDGHVDWSRPVAEVDRLIRASGHPYPGAYTCLVQDGRLRKLIIWRARIVAMTTKDVGVPGHVIRNDREVGETHVLCGEGILAIQEAQYADEAASFEPGHAFRSIRFRLGLDQGALVDLLERMMRPVV